VPLHHEVLERLVRVGLLGLHLGLVVHDHEPEREDAIGNLGRDGALPVERAPVTLTREIKHEEEERERGDRDLREEPEQERNDRSGVPPDPDPAPSRRLVVQDQREQEKDGREEIFPDRDPRHRLHVRRMDRVEERRDHAEGEAPEEPAHDEEGQHRVEPRQDHRLEMEPEWVQPPERVVDHVRDEVKGEVVREVGGREREADVLGREPPNPGIVRDVRGIVPAREEAETERRLMGEEGDAEHGDRGERELKESPREPRPRRGTRRASFLCAALRALAARRSRGGGRCHQSLLGGAGGTSGARSRAFARSCFGSRRTASSQSRIAASRSETQTI
jgi:hypothetical protein